jgi:uncharacterized protein YjiS (DUF1127 family)
MWSTDMALDTPITLSPAAYAGDALRRLGKAPDADKMPIKFAQPRTVASGRRSVIASLWRALVEWRRRRPAAQTMRDLSQLDDRLLADIGLVRGDPAYAVLAANWYVGAGYPDRPTGARREGWDHL